MLQRTNLAVNQRPFDPHLEDGSDSGIYQHLMALSAPLIPLQKDAEDKLAELRGQFDEHKTTQDGHMARIKAALPVKAKEEAEKALGYVRLHFRARDA